MTTRITRAAALLMACGAVGALIPGAHAQTTHTSRITPISATTLTFTETPSSATVAISGGAIIADEPFTLSVILGSWWNLEVSGRIDDFVDDEIYLTVSLQHLAGFDAPHPLGTRFSTTYTVLAENYDDGSYTITGAGATYDHGNHQDRFFNNYLQFSKSTDNFPIPDSDEIDSWTFNLQAEHIPAPGAFTLAGVGALIASRRRGRP